MNFREICVCTCTNLSECKIDSDCPEHLVCGDEACVACGGFITAPSGYLSSPCYPNNYANNLDCEWHINVPEGEQIKIDFVDFNVYADYWDWDYCRLAKHE